VTTIEPSQTVADITMRVPGAARTFERLGIDYCCRGKLPLQEACAQLQVPVDEVLRQLSAAASGREAPDIPKEDATALIQLILERHHAFERAELTRLMPLALKVERVHGMHHPELATVRGLVQALEDDLLPHMVKEERVLFPYVESLAQGAWQPPAFGSVANPIRMMNVEHEQVGAILAALRAVTNEYRPPSDACGSYNALYAGIGELSADIHEHVHRENFVLFPLAERLELKARG
jgi:regulator of cell morphogenesis and NO signaling